MISRQITSSVRIRSTSVRYLSALASKNPNSITLSELQGRLNSSNAVKDDDTRAILIKNINQSTNEQKDSILRELFNDVDNFSLYFKLKDVRLPPHSVLRFIELNLGRVYNAWDILHNNSLYKDNELTLRVIEKLLNGETCEQEEFICSNENLSKIMHLLSDIDAQISDASLSTLITRLDESNLITLLELVEVTPKRLLEILQENKELLEYTRLKMFNYIFNKDPMALGLENVVQILDLISKLERENSIPELTETHIKAYESFLQEKYFNPPTEVDIYNIQEFKATLFAFIEETKLDLEKEPESLLLRLKLIDIYGMTDKNIKKTLEKFHSYQSHAKYGIDLIQAKMILVFCYHAIFYDNRHNLKIAETLLTDQLSIKTLLTLIVANGYFDIESALQLYNDYIGVVGKEVNKETQRSPSGLLTESILLAHLYHQDREFAFLILEKAVENGIVSNELEIATIKKLFKVYGISFNEDDKEKSKQYMKDYILQDISHM